MHRRVHGEGARRVGLLLEAGRPDGRSRGHRGRDIRVHPDGGHRDVDPDHGGRLRDGPHRRRVQAQPGRGGRLGLRGVLLLRAHQGGGDLGGRRHLHGGLLLRPVLAERRRGHRHLRGGRVRDLEAQAVALVGGQLQHGRRHRDRRQAVRGQRLRRGVLHIGDSRAVGRRRRGDRPG